MSMPECKHHIPLDSVCAACAAIPADAGAVLPMVVTPEFKIRYLATVRGVPAQVMYMPEMGSKIVNDACWAFFEAMPAEIPAPVWNNLKPAIYASLQIFHMDMVRRAAHD